MKNKCRHCEKESISEMYNLCEDHNCCEVCGRRKDEVEQSWIKIDGKDWFWICGECEEKRIENEIEKFQEKNKDEKNFYSDRVVICPYCGCEHENDYDFSGFYNEGEHEFTRI